MFGRKAVEDPRMVIVLRRDLGMRRGKEIAQTGHAVLGPVFNRLIRVPFTRCYLLPMDAAMDAWKRGSFKKICVTVRSEDELLAVRDAAVAAGLPCCLITDQGHTEFHGVATHTCLAVGPAAKADLDPVTGGLPLY